MKLTTDQHDGRLKNIDAMKKYNFKNEMNLPQLHSYFGSIDFHNFQQMSRVPFSSNKEKQFLFWNWNFIWIAFTTDSSNEIEFTTLRFI
ncbi:hypothetical protein Bhyg_12817 [Pseudolycoriella hygida]|uniref:Uncharacterized protein n=1 Tax=Pseudolycoriella hygida TaxID=35572 RepID=A0A9Q0S1M3_9DIPT|nr:hypothetical protein Bhyg_12817 [Pseudolycoriella hygida]